MFKFIKRNYDIHIVKLCNRLIVTQSKYVRKSLCSEMLKQCSLKFVVPKFILFRIRNSKLKISNKVENLFLKFEITKIEKTVNHLNTLIEALTKEMKNKIKPEDFKNFVNK